MQSISNFTFMDGDGYITFITLRNPPLVAQEIHFTEKAVNTERNQQPRKYSLWDIVGYSILLIPSATIRLILHNSCSSQLLRTQQRGEQKDQTTLVFAHFSVGGSVTRDSCCSRE